MEFTIIDADAHHLDGAAYKKYLPEKFRARSGPYFPSFGWDIFLNDTTGRKPSNPEEYCKDLDVEKIADAVAYPSNALSIGLVRELDLAVAAGQGLQRLGLRLLSGQRQSGQIRRRHRAASRARSGERIASRGDRKRRRRRDDADLRAARLGPWPAAVRSDLRRGAGARRARRFSRHRPSGGRQHAFS